MYFFFSKNDKIFWFREFFFIFIYDKKDVTVKDLQKSVWDYSPELETHTVETHIYRLRKKITEKFMDDKFILNNKDGYYLWKKGIR